MESTATLPSDSVRFVTLTDQPQAATLRFHPKLWDLFHPRQITDRLEAWTEVANGAWFRVPVRWWFEQDGALHAELPPLPDGFVSLAQLPADSLDERAKGLLIVAVCEALSRLHQQRFHMGFLSPDLVHIHPERLDVLFDLQPFPSVFPFVNHLIEEFPFILFSRFARHHQMPRVADYYAVGLLIQWVYLGQWPKEPRTVCAPLPEGVHGLCERLMKTPESFLFVEEIADAFRVLLGHPLPLREEPAEAKADWLHPMDPPISRKSQEMLRAFLRSEGRRLIGLFCKDEAIRFDVLSHHMNEVLESQYFFTIACNPLPFATFREAIERTMVMARKYLPEASAQLHSLGRKLNRLLKQHTEGDELIHSLTEWLHSFYREVLPLFQLQSFTYIFENCEQLDEDSQRVFLSFWKKHGNDVTGLYAIFSGSRPPSLFPANAMRCLKIGRKEADLYRRLLTSQLGRADHALIAGLAEWMSENELDYPHCRTILQELADSGQIVLTRRGWEMAPTFALDADRLSVERLIAERVSGLSGNERELLRLFVCLPLPIRARSMFLANGLDTKPLSDALTRLWSLGLVHVFHDNSLFVPKDVAAHVLGELPLIEQMALYQKALPLQRNYRPSALPPLIEMARLAGDARTEYFYLIKYYRQVRSLLSLEQRKRLLESIRNLQHVLAHTSVLCWDRLLCKVYLRLNQHTQAERLARSLYERTGKPADRFYWQRILMMFTDRLDLSAMRLELLRFVGDPANGLKDKIHAAHLLTTLDFFVPLRRKGAEVVNRFYITELYPGRHHVSTRLFAEFTIMYTIMLFQYFPEYEEWACALLEKLESTLETSPHHDLMIELFNSYIFTATCA